MGTSRVRRMTSRLTGAFTLLALTTLPLAAQSTGSIRATVTDGVTARPLVGAQVSVEGVGLGGLANANGQVLILNVPAGPQTVRATLIGYGPVTREVTVVAGQVATLDITLQQVALEMDALVVTGTAQGTQKRAIGNSVSSFSASQVTDAVPVLDVQQLLQARTPGLTLIADGGAAGDGSAIRLRGSGSLNASFEPIVYVDGVRVQGGTNNFDDQCGSVTHCTDAFDFLNPNDIESIEVIKGPAAATLYGADAAAGVIQIVTKKGAPGRGIQWQAGFDAGITDWHEQRPITFWQCTAANVNPSSNFPGCHNLEPGTVLNFDPMSRNALALRGNDGSPDSNGAGQYNFNISARGGGPLFNFFISAENGDEQGIFHNNFSRRNSGRANFGFTPSQNLNINVNLGYARTHVRMPLANNSSNSILRNGMRGRANATFQFEEGFRNFGPELANEWDQQTRAERYTIGATINYQPFPWLQNRLVLGLDNTNREVTDFTSPESLTASVSGGARGIGFIDITTPNIHVWTLDYAGTISNDISENVTSQFSSGVQLTRTQAESFGATGEGLVSGNLRLVGSAATTFGDQNFQEQTSLGFYFQEQVGYKNRLFATAAVRVDDNSAFGQDFSLVVYPKAQLSYVISEEDFFDYGFVDELKLRGAWGQAGNPPQPFVAERTFSPSQAVENGSVVNILRPASFGNPDLKAETGSEIELGFDASLFGGRAGVEFTYYNQKTKDALIAVPAPPSTGFGGSFFTNVGEISNEGIELLLTGSPVYKRNFQWDATVALSTNENELVTWGDAPLTEISFGSFATVQKHVPGFPLGGFWGLDVIRDANGEPVLTNGNVTVSDEFEYVGPSLPTREIAFTNVFTLFNDFRLYTNFDYKGGHYQWCAICSVRSRIDLNTKLINDPNSDPTEVLVVRSLQTRRWIQEADFIKLRELSLSYSLPGNLVSQLGVDNATVTVSGRNLWMWTKYEFDEQEGLGSPDPEVNFNSNSAFGRTDYASIPNLRTFSVGMRVSF
ncbi:MAG: SusC/RagA family TonB-linked outer membrane protein [Longimicrobiales bacterium]|nr:SusC/RagA family TonB-linked outer membrane protein [Longimicrobiales bacterium]